MEFSGNVMNLRHQGRAWKHDYSYCEGIEEEENVDYQRQVVA
jgi:hypothetical protein